MMKIKKKLSPTIPFILIFLFSFLSFSCKKGGSTEDTGFLKPVPIDPRPQDPGPYEVCICTPVICETPYPAKYFAPVLNSKSCTTEGRFDLVLIAHLDSAGDGTEAYNDLADHLASNGFMVVIFDRNSMPADFETYLSDRIDFLYEDSPVADYITDNIAIIGHSRGGRDALENVHVFSEKGKNLRAFVAMAPTMRTDDQIFRIPQVQAFLGLHNFRDTDPSAFGDKAPGRPMRSTFKYYDDAGLQFIVTDPDPTSTHNSYFTVEKDMIYMNVPGGHLFQNGLITRTYINAFLQLHLHGRTEYQRFFKFQERPFEFNNEFIQQHHDRVRYVLANFENGEAEVNNLGGSIEIVGNYIYNLVIGPSFVLDDFSPHNTTVLNLEYDPLVGASENDRLEFSFNGPKDLSAFRYLSFRVTQVYDSTPGEGTPPVLVSFRIHLLSADASNAVNLVDFGGPLEPYETITTVPALPPAVAVEEQTKNAMRSFLIPLSAFEGVDLSQVESLWLDFSEMLVPTHIELIFDDIEFLY